MTDVTEKTAIRIAEGLEDLARAIHTFIDVEAGKRIIGKDGAANSRPPSSEFPPFDGIKKAEPKAETKAKPKPAKPAEPEADKDSLDLGKEPIDLNTVKTLINKKLADGADRKDIRDILGNHGASAMSQLTSETLPKVYKEIEEL